MALVEISSPFSEASNPLLWTAIGTAITFLLFLAVAEGVALFHPTEEVRARAHEILRDLLQFLCDVLRFLFRSIR